MRDGFDQALGRQLPEHFPDGRARHASLLDQFTLDEALAGLKPHVNDRAAELLEHLLSHGGRDSRHTQRQRRNRSGIQADRYVHYRNLEYHRRTSRQDDVRQNGRRVARWRRSREGRNDRRHPRDRGQPNYLPRNNSVAG